MSFIKFAMRHGSKFMVGAALAGVISGVLNTLLIKTVNNTLLEQSATNGWMFLTLVVTCLGASLMSRIWVNQWACSMVYQLRLGLFRHILDMPLRQLENIGNSKMNSTFSQDLRTMVETLVKLPTLLTSIVVTVGCLVYLGILSPQILLVLVGFFAFAIATYLIPERFAIGFMKSHRRTVDRLYREFDNLLAGVKELKLNQHRRAAFLDQHIMPVTEKARLTELIHKNIYAVLNSWHRLMFFAFIGILLFLVPQLFSVDMKLLVSFAITVLFLLGPLDEVVGSIPKLHLGQIAFNHLKKVGCDPEKAYEKQLQKPVPQRHLPPFQGMALRDVTHSYRRENEDHFFQLGPINLNLQAGEVVFLVGGNGSGKTTLAKIICGLYPPESGHVLCNGQIVEAADMHAYRQNFSAIFNHFHVFQDLLGLPSETLAERTSFYLERLHLDRKVQLKGSQLSQVDLSTGQRKRLALLATYLEDRPFVLFDEWAADQDPEFKRVFYQELLPELKQMGKTVLVISHDDRYFHLADRILKLEEGLLKDSTPQPSPVSMMPLVTTY